MKKSSSFEHLSLFGLLQVVVAEIKNNWRAWLKLIFCLWPIFSVAWGLRHEEGLSLNSFFNSAYHGLLWLLGVLFSWVLIWRVLWRISIFLLLKYPRRFFGGTGVFVSLMLLGSNVFKWYLGLFTPFQESLALPMILLDVLCAGAIAYQATIKTEHFSSPGRIATFILAYNAVFLNILTVANNVNAWKDIMPIVYMAGVLNLLFVGGLITKKFKVNKK